MEHFYLYNHLSTDNYEEILAPYVKEGIVELRQVKKVPENSAEWNRIQTGVYDEVAKEVKDSSKWLMILDTDEFLFSVNEKKLITMLKDYNDYASLSVNWIIFSNSGC